MSVLERFRLDDKVVVLTGASGGLGLGFARALGEAGASLVLAARRDSELQKSAEELDRAGVVVEYQVADVAKVDDCARVAAKAVSAFGRIDVLINNAGIASSTSALSESPQKFQDVMTVNVAGSFWMAQACAPHMPRGSAIVNVGSVLGQIGPRFPHAAYAASKAAILGLTRDLAQEWTERRGIRVNTLCPGYFASDMTASGHETLETMLRTHSIMPRFGEQEELDAALIFLASEASSYMTGTSITVDGGLSVL